MDDRMETYLAGFGIGDALRIVAVLAQRPGRKHVRVEAEPYLGAFGVLEALDPYFNITYEPIPCGAWDASPLEDRADLQCPEALHYTARIADGPLALDSLAFRVPQLDPELNAELNAGPYTVVQPSTCFNKVRRLQGFEHWGRGGQARTILVGHMRDLGINIPGALDLRGRLSLRESIEVVRRSSAVVGVESWVPILGALWGKPVVHQISRRAARDLELNWSILFPTMGFRIEDE